YITVAAAFQHHPQERGDVLRGERRQDGPAQLGLPSVKRVAWSAGVADREAAVAIAAGVLLWRRRLGMGVRHGGLPRGVHGRDLALERVWPHGAPRAPRFLQCDQARCVGCRPVFCYDVAKETAMIKLTKEQRQAVQRGEAVSFLLPEIGETVVMLREDQY